MRARFRSYGETSTRTRSPGRIRIRKRRILPATWPRTSCPLSSCTRNMAFGSASTTSPSNSTFSSFAKPDRVLDHSHVGCLWALRAFAELVLDLRALGERTESVALDGGEVHERVLAALIGGDEAEALLVAEPLHDSGWHLLEHPLHACAAPHGAALTAGLYQSWRLSRASRCQGDPAAPTRTAPDRTRCRRSEPPAPPAAPPLPLRARSSRARRCRRRGRACCCRCWRSRRRTA